MSAMVSGMARACDALFTAILLAACTPAPDRGSAPPAPRAARAPDLPAPPAGRTANDDARGFANQPDYDAEAALLKEQVTSRLPDPLRPGPGPACAAMFAAADALYRDIEPGGPEAAAREGALKLLLASREADQRACERDTSVRAAACVTVLLRDQSAELPWLLDHCSRAFPD